MHWKKHKWTKRMWLGLSLVLFLMFYACGNRIEPGTITETNGTRISALVATAQISEEPAGYDAVGTVRSELASTLASTLLGAVRKVNVREGTLVKAGDVLVEIDQRHVEAQANQASAGYSEARQTLSAALSAKTAAKAQEELARTTFERYQKLMKNNSVSRQEFDEARAKSQEATAALSQTQAQVEAAAQRAAQAKAALAGARAEEKDSLVRAPYDGIVTAKFINDGDLAAPGTRLLSLEGTTGLRVDFLMPESLIQAVSVGKQVQAAVPGTLKKPVPCTVTVISPSADSKSRSFLVQAALPAGTGLRSGMFARVSVPLGPGGLLLIPRTAVIQRGQLDAFFLVDGNGKARFRLLRLGRGFGDRVEVLSGMQPGTRYVAAPPPELTDSTVIVGMASGKS